MRFGVPFDMVRVHAAERVLDRLEDKPTQKVETESGVALEMLVLRAHALASPEPEPLVIDRTGATLTART
jgi:hypothetical protein